MSVNIPWIEVGCPLPDACEALTEPAGLVAAGADLSCDRLSEAYGKGLFPWFSPGDPVLWWSPNPRMVLKIDQFHISKSMRKLLRQIERKQQSGNFSLLVTTDVAFDAVLEGCATRGQRDNTEGTWITSEMKEAYRQWHKAGKVHSVETWANGQLVGGLYGVCLGRQFFGESMFSRTANASKVAVAHLVAFLKQHQVKLIDCQMQTDHLISLGAQAIPRSEFLTQLKEAVAQPAIEWASGWLSLSGICEPVIPNTANLPY